MAQGSHTWLRTQKIKAQSSNSLPELTNANKQIHIKTTDQLYPHKHRDQPNASVDPISYIMHTTIITQMQVIDYWYMRNQYSTIAMYYYFLKRDTHRRLTIKESSDTLQCIILFLSKMLNAWTWTSSCPTANLLFRQKCTSFMIPMSSDSMPTKWKHND